jgi:hypothetical protein
VGDFEKVSRERDGHGGHTPSLRNEQQDPSVDERDGWMEGFAQVCVLTSDLRPARSELGVDKGSGERDGSSGGPGAEDQERCVDLLCDYVGIDEDARTDDASHDEHHCIEQAQAAEEARHQFIKT